MTTLRTVVARSGLIVMTVAALLCGGPQPTFAALIPFPDIPPWHWAYDAVTSDQAAGLVVGYPTSPEELAGNAIRQVYGGFAHAGAAQAQSWVERFTFNRPANWPAPLEHSPIAAFSLSPVRVILHGDSGIAVFTATVRTTADRTLTTPVRVNVRANGQDWQVDYAGLAAADPVFH